MEEPTPPAVPEGPDSAQRPEPRSRRFWSRLINTIIGVFTLGLGVLIALVLFVRGNAAQAGAPDPLSVAVALTDEAQGLELSVQPSLELSHRHPHKGVPVISVNTDKPQQRITGFGVTMTEGSATLLENRLQPDARNQLLASVFGTGGLDLNVLRVPMGATSASQAAAPYTYDDGSVDPDLAHFSISRDVTSMLPALRQAYAHNYSMRFLATPWSMPAWMKRNDAITNVDGDGKLNPAYAQAYAEYFVKFIQDYLNQHIPISAITPANSPGLATERPGMNISAHREIALINDALVPALRQAGLQTRIYGGDLSWSSIRYASTLATSTAVTQLIGIAYHCYTGSPELMSTVHALSNGLGAIVSECSPDTTSTPIPEVIISSLRNWASQVDLGRLASDITADMTLAAAAKPDPGLVTVDPATGGATENESYFELGQASEFIRPGAYRVPTNTFVHYTHNAAGTTYARSGIDDVAALNPDGSIALMAYNNSSSAQTFAVRWHGDYATYTLPGHATVSFRWRQGGLHALARESTSTATSTAPAATSATTAAENG